MMPSRGLRLFAVFSLMLFLNACQTTDWTKDLDFSRFFASNKAQKAPDAMQEEAAQTQICPPVELAENLNRLHQFTDLSRPSQRNEISSVEIAAVDSVCETQGDSVNVTLDIDFEGKLGARARQRAGDQPFFAYPYFIAITDQSGEILAKDVFAASIAYDDEDNSILHSEQVKQQLPLGQRTAGDYKIQLGFQLNEEELDYNRSHTP